MKDRLNGAAVISKEVSDEYNGILHEYRSIVDKIDDIKHAVSSKDARVWRLNLLIETLQGLDENPQVCDERLWINIVEKAVVNSKDDFIVTFHGGIEVKGYSDQGGYSGINPIQNDKKPPNFYGSAARFAWA